MPVRIPQNPLPTPINNPTPLRPAPAPVPATVTPAPAPINNGGWVPRPAPAPAPQPAPTDLFGGGVRPRPAPLPNRGPVLVAGTPAATLHKDDLPPINERFDHAAADGLISAGEVDVLIHSIASRSMTDDDVTQLKAAIAANTSKLDPAAAARLNSFVAGEVPMLRAQRSTEQALGVHNVVAAWDPPTTNTDGTPLTDLAGYKMHVGSQPGVWDQVIDIPDPGAAGYVIDKLTSGPKYFMVTAYDTAHNESGPSNQTSKVIP